MSLDWKSNDLHYLRSQLEIGRVVLFAGAGFSLGAKNKFGNPLPMGKTLAELLASKAGMPYNGESLPTVYDAISTRIRQRELWAFLQELYAVKSADPWLRFVTAITWHRIYTTNIDNLFQFLGPYDSKQSIRTIVRGMWPAERDQHFDPLQCIHLHGHIEHEAHGVSFTLPDFAAHTARPDPWYQDLTDDLFNRPVLFIGTALEEPILSHYLELRGLRISTQRDYRHKSFLVSPEISPIRAAALEKQRIVPLSVAAGDFFDSLAANITLAELNLANVRSRVFPGLYKGNSNLDRSITNHFDLIVPDALPPAPGIGVNQFFLGAEPTWQDIKEERDGRRTITDDLVEVLKLSSKTFRCVALHGHPGSGKTTALMRAAHDLAAGGGLVFFARGLSRLDLSGVLELLESEPHSPRPAFVFIDLVSAHLAALATAHERLIKIGRLTLVVSDRTNKFFSQCQRVQELSPATFTMPDLSDQDVNNILDKLDKFGFLGVLKDKARTEQLRLFMEHASRQLLVAMREATFGKKFDLILQDEYEHLEGSAKLAYTICCIAVSQGAPGIYTKHLMPCIPASQFTKGFVVNELLRGVLVPANQTGTMVKPRHRIIAQLVAEELSDPPLRLKAIETFLGQVSSNITPNQIREKNPAFLAYRGMINSKGLGKLLKGETDAILALYESVRPYFTNDSLFWLQYGMANIAADRLDFAENFLNQSLQLRPNSHQTLHHLAILHLVKATKAQNPAAAKDEALEGMAILNEQIQNRGDFDYYPFHAYLVYVARWYLHAGHLVTDDEWEALVKVGKLALKKYPMNDEILEAYKQMEHSYLVRVIPPNATTTS